MIDLSNNSQNNSLIFKSISTNLSTASTEMPSIESSIFTQPKHLCIRLATGPQYYS